jgi:hypothetical protein
MVVFVAAVVVLIGLVVSSGDATGTLSALVLLAVSAAGIWLALALRSKRRLSLLIETAGGHVGAISSRSSSNDDVIDSLHEAIVRAIDNPQAVTQTLSFGDLIVGDKIGRDKFEVQGDMYQVATT